MTTLNLTVVPSSLQSLSAHVESATPTPNCALEIPGLVGWGGHEGVRQRSAPTQTHVCASSYDHIGAELKRDLLRSLFHNYPQPDMLVSIAGAPDVIGIDAALAALALPAGLCRETYAQPAHYAFNDVYAANPIFALHQVGKGMEPLALVACRYRLIYRGRNSLLIQVHLDRCSVHPDHRRRGLAKLALLEAARWLGMLSTSLVLDPAQDLTLEQQVIAAPKSDPAYRLAQTFLGNYLHFTLTDDRIDRCRDGLSTASQRLQDGFAAIVDHVGVRDLIDIPADAFELGELATL